MGRASAFEPVSVSVSGTFIPPDPTDQKTLPDVRSFTLVSKLTGKSGLAYPEAVGDVFKALADPTRRKILDELTEEDPQTLFEICTRLTMKHGIGSSRQAISQHLEVLEDAGLVRSERSGRYKLHHLDTTPLDEITTRWPRKE